MPSFTHSKRQKFRLMNSAEGCKTRAAFFENAIYIESWGKLKDTGKNQFPDAEEYPVLVV